MPESEHQTPGGRPDHAEAAPARVRAATPGDLELLVEFNRAMARETEGLDLDPGRLRSGVGRVLADPDAGFYRIAELGGAAADGPQRGSGPVGCLMVTREWSDWRDGWFWWIQSVFVDPAWRRRGVYRALYASVLGEGQEAPDVCGVRLYVDSDNRAAQRVYERLGMAEAHYRMFEVDFVLER